jgi:hypothetical protein
MTTRIEAVAETSRWGVYTAWAHLRIDSSRLAADVAAGADPQIIASDRAAVSQSSRQIVRSVGGSGIDVSV